MGVWLGLDTVSLQRGALDGICWTGTREKSLGQEGSGRGTACLLHTQMCEMCDSLISSQGFLGFSQTLKPISLGSPSMSLALIFPHVILKCVLICCPPKALTLPEAPTLPCIQLCSIGSWFRQNNLCLGSKKDVSCFSAPYCQAGSTCPSLG